MQTKIIIIALVLLASLITFKLVDGYGAKNELVSDPCKQVIAEYEAGLSFNITTQDYMSFICADTNDLYEVALILAELKARHVSNNMKSAADNQY